LKTKDLDEGPFSLGRWSRLAGLLSVLWLTYTSLALFIP
jgi:hypothetical protein